jgi:hypothetical protein
LAVIKRFERVQGVNEIGLGGAVAVTDAAVEHRVVGAFLPAIVLKMDEVLPGLANGGIEFRIFGRGESEKR